MMHTNTNIPPSTAAKKFPFPKVEQLRASVAAAPLIKELLSRVPAQKPNRKDFFQVRPDEDRMCPGFVYEDKEDQMGVYLVVPEMVPHMLGEAIPVTLVETINRQNVTMIWPLKMPSDTGNSSWQESALMAADRAKTSWVRMAADMSLGAYRIFEAKGQLSEPNWTDMPFQELLELAFKGRVIDNEDHPVLKRLQGRT